MIIGHLPVGYFINRYLIKKLKLPLNKVWLGLGILAALLPDLDYAYWIFSNSQNNTHRGYVTGYPLFYLTLFLLSVIIYSLIKKIWLKSAIIVIFINIFIHFVLDTVFYGIKWLYPLSGAYVGIYNVGGYGSGTGIQVPNYWNHWYWYLELLLWAIAIISVIISFKRGEFDLKNDKRQTTSDKKIM